MKVLAAMSGGVDSSFAAARMVDAGHDVVGVHLALSSAPGTLRTGSRGCCSKEDASDARRVADVLGIPFYVWDFAERFKSDCDCGDEFRMLPGVEPVAALADPLVVVVVPGVVNADPVLAACGSTTGALFCWSVVLKSDFGKLLGVVALELKLLEFELSSATATAAARTTPHATRVASIGACVIFNMLCLLFL